MRNLTRKQNIWTAYGEQLLQNVKTLVLQKLDFPFYPRAIAS